jgi:hypothetical protein
MSEKTVEVGDAEVRIEETDDGFEVTEVDDTDDIDDLQRHLIEIGVYGSNEFLTPDEAPVSMSPNCDIVLEHDYLSHHEMQSIDNADTVLMGKVKCHDGNVYVGLADKR